MATPLIALHPLDPEDASAIAPMRSAARVGGTPGLWVHPASSQAGEAILHLHGGWFNFESAKASTLALDAIGKFLTEKLQDGHS